MLLALICPAPAIFRALLFVNCSVVLTLKLAAPIVIVPVELLLTNAEPELAFIVALFVAVLKALPAPEAPMLPVPAVNVTVEPVTRPDPVMLAAALRDVAVVDPVPMAEPTAISPDCAVRDTPVPEIVPAPDTLIPLLFVSCNVFATVKLAAPMDKIPTDVLLR